MPLAGAGELLPLVEDSELKGLWAEKLLEVMEASDEFPEMRGAAYLGIEAAVGLAPAERAPADRLLDLGKDASPQYLMRFIESMACSQAVLREPEVQCLQVSAITAYSTNSHSRP